MRSFFCLSEKSRAVRRTHDRAWVAAHLTALRAATTGYDFAG
jgi:hypothetical protein